ncbi:MAG: T9SS type A sorting domain-containing protein [Schleiferiaceae bacterium]|nr:T9SS type A sorting domain-containing protein [Schleiferiaceae bacterium]
MKKLLLPFIIMIVPFFAFGQCPVPTFVVTPSGLGNFTLTSATVPNATITWGPNLFIQGTGPIWSPSTATLTSDSLIVEVELVSCAYIQVRAAQICSNGVTSAFTPFSLVSLERTTATLPPFGPDIVTVTVAGAGTYAIPDCYIPQHDTLPNGVIQHWQYGNMGPGGLPPLPNLPFFVNNNATLYLNGLTQTGSNTLKTPWYNFNAIANFNAEARFSIFNQQTPGLAPPTILIVAEQQGTGIVDTVLFLNTITTAWQDVTYSFANKGFVPGNHIGLKVIVDYNAVTSQGTSTVWMTPFRLGAPEEFTCNNAITVLEHDRDAVNTAQIVVNNYRGNQNIAIPSSLSVIYGPVGFTPFSGVATTASFPLSAIPAFMPFAIDTFTLQNLLPNMAYDVYIYDTCERIGAGQLQGPFLISSTPDTILQGKIVFDNLQNCSPNQAGVPFQQLLLLPDSIYTVSNHVGNFEFRPTTQGPWQIELLPDNNPNGFIRSLCSPVATLTVPVVPNSNLYTGINFFLTTTSQQLQVNQTLMNYLVYNQHFIHQLELHFNNFTTSPIVDLNFSLTSPTVTLMPNAASNPAITFFSSDSIHFNYANVNIPVGGMVVIQQAVRASLNTTTVGQFLPTTVTIHQPTGLGTMAFVDSFEVVAAYDPNDKMVTPSGEIFAFADELEYRIRFQNTGNFFATNVVVTDTLPSEIDLENLQVQAASHNFRLERKGNVAHFIFDNIFLPDSASDPDGSIGYFIFKAPLKTPMALGDSISNRAYIYFDFQAPIITNDAWVKVVENTVSVNPSELNQRLNVFPNPSQGTFTINFDMASIRYMQLQVINAMGQVVLQDGAVTTSDFYQKTIDLNGQAKGVYLLQIKTEKGIVSKRLVLQ